MKSIIPAIALMALLSFSGTAMAGHHNPCNPCDMKKMDKHNPCDMGKKHNPCDMKDMKKMNKHNPCDMRKMKKHNPCSK